MAKPANKNGAITEEQESSHQAARTRSPAYPGINLETAIKRARDLYAQDKMNPVPVAIAVKRWGFKEKSSGGLIAIAALKSFGLMRDTGSGKDRKMQLTDEARRILLDTRQDSQERDLLIKEAALKPKIHESLWKQWGADLPADDTLRHALIFEKSFNENAVNDFVKEYKDTIRLAKLSQFDSLSLDEGDKNRIKVGDYVEWEVQGVVQFESKRVTALSDDEDFAFVEGSNTGLPIDELRKIAPPAENKEDEQGRASLKRHLPRSGMNNEVFTLEEGEVTLQWPANMSPESYEDFKGWLDLIAKKVKRTTTKKDAANKPRVADEPS